MDNHILSALKAIDVSNLSRADWIAVGMALKEEGYPCSIWDDWSRNDKRYHAGECERKWSGFRGNGTPVKSGTIVQMAKEHGWMPFAGEDGCMNWDDTIEYDGDDGFNGFTPPDSWDPAADLITYMELLFDADDRVGYVTNDVWQDAEGRWLPSKGVYDRTAGELIASLKKHPDDIGATIGDWKTQVGAWIRFNALDGDGVKNENVATYRYALVESDTLPIAEQDSVFRKLELPIAALVHSGGKSLHAMELCIAIAEGTHWLGFPCKKGRVLYVNLEIDPASAINRFLKIYEALGLPVRSADNIVVWNLRGYAVPLDKLVPKLVRRARDQHFDAIVIDPIYKVITGDENNASEMGAFCNQFDKICTETGCATIYCHHHSKGAQGAKRAMDRASGSGVFARDPDAQLDMIQLDLTEDMKNNLRDGCATAWRMESSLREFANIVPVNFWFEYPIHRVDANGDLDSAFAEGNPMNNLAKSKKYTTAEERRNSIDTAFDACNMGVPVTVRDLAQYLNLSERCIRDRLKELPDDYWVHQGIVCRKTDDGKTDFSTSIPRTEIGLI